jgi:hypothetical protein
MTSQVRDPGSGHGDRPRRTARAGFDPQRAWPLFDGAARPTTGMTGGSSASTCWAPTSDGNARTRRRRRRRPIGAVRAISAARAVSGAATALAGFDDFELADVLGLPLTIAAYDPQEIGRQAASLLMDRMSGASTSGARRIVVPTNTVEYG